MSIRTSMFASLRMTVSAACIVSVTAPSLAQAGDPSARPMEADTRSATAESRHRAGVVAYAKGHYRDAIDLFLEADRLRGSAAISFNVARCYEQLDDASGALAWYRDYLRRADHPSDAKQVARLIARFEKRLAQKGVQQLTVITSPRGATVLIDRNPVGVSPWTGELAPGPHSLDLTLRGFEDLSQSFDLPSDHALDIELELAYERTPEQAQPVLGETRSVFEAQRAQAQLSATASSPTQRKRTTALTPLGWTLLGAGGAALGGALTFEVLRHSAEKDAQRETRQIQFAHDVETMHSRQTVARVLAGVGATLVVAGGIVLFVGSGRTERAPATRLALACAPDRCQASLTDRF